MASENKITNGKNGIGEDKSTETRKENEFWKMNDNPINNSDEDQLSMENHVKGFANFIRTCDMPLTISVQGKWGSGKTSFFQLVREKIQKSQETDGLDKCMFLTFNAWQYSQFGNADELPITMLAALTNQIEKLKKEHAKDKDGNYENKWETESPKAFSDTTRKVISICASLASGYIKQKFDIDLLKQADTYLDRYEDSKKLESKMEGYLRKITEIELLRGSFDSCVIGALRKEEKITKKQLKEREKTKKKWLKEQGVDENEEHQEEQIELEYKRMVIFIDDLDRLMPEKAIELLEVLKIFMDSPHCIFVLAIDYDVVIKGVEAKYKGKLSKEKFKEYFEKVIQIVFRLPNAMLSMDEYILDICKKLDIRQQHSKDVVGFAKAAGIDNPRGVKRLINNYKLYRTINPDNFTKICNDTKSDYPLLCLFGLLCLWDKEPAVFNKISENLGNLEKILYEEYYLASEVEDDPESNEGNKFIKFFISWLIKNKNPDLKPDEFEESLRISPSKKTMLRELRHKMGKNDFAVEQKGKDKIAILKQVIRNLNFKIKDNDSEDIDYDDIMIESIGFSLPEIDISYLEQYDTKGREVRQEISGPTFERKITIEEAYLETLKLVFKYCYQDGIKKLQDRLRNKPFSIGTGESDENTEIIHLEGNIDIRVKLFEDDKEYLGIIKDLAKTINISVNWGGYGYLYEIPDDDQERSTQEDYFDFNLEEENDEIFLDEWDEEEYSEIYNQLYEEANRKLSDI